MEVKTEIKTESDVEIKIENIESGECVGYPEDIDELFRRREPQLVLLQVSVLILFGRLFVDGVSLKVLASRR